jgi:carbonic anhydrase
MYKPYNTVKTADEALALLKSGNERFVQGSLSNKSDYTEERKVLATGQHPYAVILTCSDSRTPPEILFDQKLGDLFVIRNAGNIADSVSLGSIEYAVEHLKSPLVVVAGHSKCGAVIAAYQGAALGGNLQTVIDAIQPACSGCADEDDAIRSNINRTVKQISENEAIKRTGATVTGAYYNIETGVVSWL